MCYERKNPIIPNGSFNTTGRIEISANKTQRKNDDSFENMLIREPKSFTSFFSNFKAGNHDRSRLLSRFGRNFGQAVTIMVQLLPGIAVTYYGDEIGMENTYYTWDQTIDPQGLNVGPLRYEVESRDKVRAPFQWDNSTSAGK